MYDSMKDYLEAEKQVILIEEQGLGNDLDVKALRFKRDLAFYNMMKELAIRVDEVYDYTRHLYEKDRGMV